MATAECKPVRSSFWEMKATVTSPALPLASSGLRGMRWIVVFKPLSDFVCSSHFCNVTTRSDSKCFHDRMVFAAEGSARIVVCEVEGRVRSVGSWQWSVLS